MATGDGRGGMGNAPSILGRTCSHCYWRHPSHDVWPLFSLLFSRDFDAETSWSRHKGDREKILTPKCSFQSAFLHVSMRLSDPSFAVWKMSIWYYANAFSRISQTFMDCDALPNVNFMCFDSMLNSQWCGANLFAWMPVTKNCNLSCRMRAKNGCRLSHFIWSNT